MKSPSSLSNVYELPSTAAIEFQPSTTLVETLAMVA
jgi:hypothetical protein